MPITNRVEEIRKQFLQDLEELPHDAHQLKLFKDKYLGRKGLVADLFSTLKNVSTKDRPNAGKVLNELRQTLNTILTKEN